MAKKYTYDEVKDIIEKSGKCRLISKEYTNNKNKLDIECICGNIFSIGLITYMGGKTQCNECTNKKMSKRFAFTYDHIKKYMDNIGLDLITTEYRNSNQELIFKDRSGYLYSMNFTNIQRIKKLEFVSANNPYAIDNLKLYIRNNEINTKLISNSYVDAFSNLEFECNGCETTFTTSWANFQTRKPIYCRDCSITIDKKADMFNKWYNIVNIMGKGEYVLKDVLSEITKNGVRRETYLILKHLACEGNYYKMSAHSFKNGSRCASCSAKKAGLKRRDTIEEFKSYVDSEVNGEYTCMSDIYEGAHNHIVMKHNICGHEYEVATSKFKNGRRCPRCADMMSVSYTHAVISLLAERYFEDVHFEYDIGFRGSKGGISRYDLYIGALNLLIEFQSRYHDSAKQIIKDKYKKDFAISKGFEYIAIDHRGQSTLECINAMFPFLSEIPSDLNLERFNKLNIGIAQELLNEGLVIKEVAEEMDVNDSAIRNAIQRGDIVYPEDYHSYALNKVKTVQLTLDGEYVNTFDSISEAVRVTGCKSVPAVLNGKLNHSGGFFWVNEDDYIAKNYTLPNKDDCVFYGMPLVQLDKNGNLLNRFRTRQEASVKTGCVEGTISYALSTKGDLSVGYYWINEEDYDSGNYTLKQPRKRGIPIVQLDLDCKYIRTWDTATKARNEHGGGINISWALKNKSTSGGFRWMYKSEYEKMIQNMQKEAI